MREEFITVREKFGESGIFTVIETQASGAEISTDIFNFIDSNLLDKYYINTYGKRKISDLAKNTTVSELADITINKYLDKWNKIILNYLDSNNLLTNYEEKIIEIGSETNQNTTTRTDRTNVSAYNDTDFLPKEEEQGTDSLNGETTTNREIIKKGIKNSDFYFKTNNYLNTFNVYAVVINDFNSIATLGVFN